MEQKKIHTNAFLLFVLEEVTVETNCRLIRVIILLASQEMEEKNGSKRSTPTLSLSLQPQVLLMHASQGFSIKRSLLSFLQKRKKRCPKVTSLL